MPPFIIFSIIISIALSIALVIMSDFGVGFIPSSALVVVLCVLGLLILFVIVCACFFLMQDSMTVREGSIKKTNPVTLDITRKMKTKSRSYGNKKKKKDKKESKQMNCNGKSSVLFFFWIVCFAWLSVFLSGPSPAAQGFIFPYRNESLKSPFREGPGGFDGVPPIKELESFNTTKISSSRKMFLALQDVSKNQRVPSLEPTLDHAVYIDSVNKPPAVVRSDKEKYADDVRDIKRYLSADREQRAVDGECDLPLKSPLPKSPLPSIPLGNPFGHSRRSSQVESTKKQGTKRETIVKELVPHASYGQNKSS